jgi:hypothetical protein
MNTFASLDAQFQAVTEGEKVEADPALGEYLRWRNDEPRLYEDAGRMPNWAYRGFVHLCRTWGKEGKPTRMLPVTDTVQQRVAEEQQRMNAFASGSQSLPIMHGLM